MAVDVPTLCGDQLEDYLWEIEKDLDVFSDRILAGARGGFTLAPITYSGRSGSVGLGGGRRQCGVGVGRLIIAALNLFDQYWTILERNPVKI
jgi:hypothetical protein